jgi:hypothetical protein
MLLAHFVPIALGTVGWHIYEVLYVGINLSLVVQVFIMLTCDEFRYVFKVLLRALISCLEKQLPIHFIVHPTLRVHFGLL